MVFWRPSPDYGDMDHLQEDLPVSIPLENEEDLPVPIPPWEADGLIPPVEEDDEEAEEEEEEEEDIDWEGSRDSGYKSMSDYTDDSDDHSVGRFSPQVPFFHPEVLLERLRRLQHPDPVPLEAAPPSAAAAAADRPEAVAPEEPEHRSDSTPADRAEVTVPTESEVGRVRWVESASGRSAKRLLDDSGVEEVSAKRVKMENVDTPEDTPRTSGSRCVKRSRESGDPEEEVGKRQRRDPREHLEDSAPSASGSGPSPGRCVEDSAPSTSTGQGYGRRAHWFRPVCFQDSDSDSEA